MKTLTLKRIPVKKTIKNVRRGLSSFLKRSVRFGKKATRKATRKVRNVTRRITSRKR